MITRKVDERDALAGFAYNWVKAIGANLERLYVITWQQSDRGGLPNNIEIFPLPENKLLKIFVLQKLLLKLLPRVNGVFCHMNPEYTILAAPLARLWRRRVISWYTHGAVTFKRRVVEILANKIVTASALSFRRPLFPDKVKVIGHGIDTANFQPVSVAAPDGIFRIISVGRISPTKDYESIIKAMAEINNKKIKLQIIGDVILEAQKSYLAALRQLVDKLNLTEQVEFVGWVANKDLAAYYQRADLFINMSGTGSVDKVVLEAMACGLLVLTANEAFTEIIGSDFMVRKNDYRALSEKIRRLLALAPAAKNELAQKFRQTVVRDYNLEDLAVKIVAQFS